MVIDARVRALVALWSGPRAHTVAGKARPQGRGSARARITYRFRYGGYLVVFNALTGYVVNPSSHISESTAPMAIAPHVISYNNV